MRKLREDEIEARWSSNRASTDHPVVVVLENVRSAYNVGAIFRTADAVALERVVVCGITATPDHKKVHKTALGAHESITWEYAPEAPPILEQMRLLGYRIAALEITDEPTSFSDLTGSDFPLCLVIGNEVTGVSENSLAHCDIALELPQFGTKHSLNAAVAFGVAAYHIVDQYRRVSVLGRKEKAAPVAAAQKT